MYRFDPSEPPANALSRVAKEELDRCLECLRASQAPLDGRVHEARKHLKKFRALLALAQGSPASEALEFARRSARLAGRALAPLRGHAALVESFDSLISRFPDELGPIAIAEVRSSLNHEQPSPDDARRSLEVTIELLEHAQQRLPELAPRGTRWKTLVRGFRRLYKRARVAYSEAKRSGAPEAFHTFRTPAKRHLYQVTLLEPIFPEALHARRDELDKLGELLGDHHDLWLLGESLRKLPGAEPQAARVSVLIRRRMQKLELAALRLGGRLFVEKPRAFSRRVQKKASIEE